MMRFLLTQTCVGKKNTQVRNGSTVFMKSKSQIGKWKGMDEDISDDQVGILGGRDLVQCVGLCSRVSRGSRECCGCVVAFGMRKTLRCGFE